MFKRGTDIVLSSLLLLVAMPILLLAALAIHLSSPGPVLFRQSRMGRGFQPFEILKLRTMAHAEAGLAYTLGPDPRITPIGKWLRRSKLDELPQLWNVLRGDMSLVGPRPVLLDLATEFRIHYKLLLRVRPGLTDPASLKYSQEARLLATAQNPLQFFKTVVIPDKIQISLDYLEQRNWWSDAATILMTLLICCCPSLRQIYGRLPKSDATNRADNLGMAVPLQSLRVKASALHAREIAIDGGFVQELARDIPAGEKGDFSSLVPWNLLRIPDSIAQSTSQEARGGGMPL
ncbi:sugar transferase [Acidicapsa ligni]|uniref:sugar transferase n=1 Tax=Acidicapsa ligni TaxID=542300 RepID=UPI00295B375C|nr:sugar transferase [Acidicapsa ligni]